jgi:hypothetical protein
VLVNIILNPDTTIGVASCFKEKAKILEILLTAVNAVALGNDQKEEKIIKPTAAQVMKVNN